MTSKARKENRVAGEDVKDQLIEIRNLADRIMHAMAPGRRYGTELLRPKAEEILDRLNAEYTALSEMPTGERWEYRSLGKTWRRLWQDMELPGLEDLMRWNGVRFFVLRDTFEPHIPKPLRI